MLVFGRTELLLGAELVGVSALSLTAVGGTRREASLRRRLVDMANVGSLVMCDNIRSTCGRSSCRSCT